MEILQGADALDALAPAAAPALHTLDEPAFRDWLDTRIEAVATDPVFLARIRLRTIQRTHRATLGPVQAAVREARAAYESCGCGPTIEKLELALRQRRQAVAGLGEAVEEGRADPAKLATAEVAAAKAEAELVGAQEACPPFAEVQRAEASLAAVEATLGLPEARAELRAIQRRRGRDATGAGSDFERLAASVLNARVLPALEAAEGHPLACLESVTLRSARGELDHVVVRPHAPGDEEGLVEVVALVETKRNPDDLGHGFTQRQENLAFFTGRTSDYDAELYRTSRYPQGRFEGRTEHHQHGRAYAFGPESFRRLVPEPDGVVLTGLWFVTDARPLHGCSTRELQTLLHRVATDPELDLDTPGDLAALRAWFLDRHEPVQAAGVLRRYAEAGRADQLLVTRRQTPDASPR